MAEMTTISLSLIGSFVLVLGGLVGIYRSLPRPPLSSFSIRRREVLENSTIFQWFHPIIIYFAAFNRKFYPPETLNDLEIRLRRAGRPCDYLAEEYLGVCQTCAMCTSAVAGLYSLLLFGIVGGFITGGLALIVGYFAPLFVLNEWMNSRVTQLVMKLPYAIDLLALCLSSGSTFVGAVEVLVKEGGDEPLDQEFRIFLTELSLGKTRREALLNLADRCGIDLLSGLVLALIQGDEQGVHIAEILKRQSKHIRDVRVALADEKASKASTKILFPTMLILMSVLLILFGGFIVKIARGRVLSE
ncbi:MAG: type II secretion system F family protein [Candidatus Riflebacteria bacterium]|nr:type II secretion system F family protein [Candidatus Riflebacteria bacterium]